MEQDFQHSVAFRSAVHVNDYLPMSRRDMTAFEGPTYAFQQAFAQAGVTHADIDFAEVHDCFTMAELLIYEAMGIKPKGRGAEAIREGIVRKDGSLPINVSGGLKAKGHPVGATGVSMHVLSAMQLVNEAGDMQVPGAKLGCVFNMGGSGVANYCSVLENAR
jgi:acetyl-CoA C-acetyltransferase